MGTSSHVATSQDGVPQMWQAQMDDSGWFLGPTSKYALVEAGHSNCGDGAQQPHSWACPYAGRVQVNCPGWVLGMLDECTSSGDGQQEEDVYNETYQP